LDLFLNLKELEHFFPIIHEKDMEDTHLGFKVVQETLNLLFGCHSVQN